MIAAKWLRWKMIHPQYFGNPIVTARDFVERVADRSRKSGQFYQVELSSGECLKLLTVLRHELEALEEALAQRAQAADSAHPTA